MNYQLYNEDCLEGMKRIPDGSIDMILSDPPYNLTDCAWDKSVIDLAAMWSEFKRILKPCSATVLFASGKFTHKLIASNFDWYKYKWIWVKNAPTMFVHAKNAPMRKFEEILIFSDGVINHASCTKKRMPYNPQGVVPCDTLVKYAAHASKVSLQGGKLHVAAGEDNNKRAYHCHGDWEKRDWRENYNWERTGRLKAFGEAYGKRPSHTDFYVQEQTGYPVDVLYYDVEPSNKKLHPTQKPVDLLEYLIKTYTNEGETVLDATCGSGSTGVAAINTGRRFIGFETDAGFYEIAGKRIAEAVAKKEQSLF